MTESEHLLTCLAEEAGEIVQACAKALRFGLDDGYPGTDRTNAGDISKECTDLMAVLELLHEHGDLEWLLPDCAKRMEAKKAKVREFMEYARKRGTLMSNNVISKPEH